MPLVAFGLELGRETWVGPPEAKPDVVKPNPQLAFPFRLISSLPPPLQLSSVCTPNIVSGSLLLTEGRMTARVTCALGTANERLPVQQGDHDHCDG